MTSTYKSKRDTKSNELYKLLSQTDISVIGDGLFTKLITKKEKEMRMKTKEKEKLLISN